MTLHSQDWLQSGCIHHAELISESQIFKKVILQRQIRIQNDCIRHAELDSASITDYLKI